MNESSASLLDSCHKFLDQLDLSLPQSHNQHQLEPSIAKIYLMNILCPAQFITFANDTII